MTPQEQAKIRMQRMRAKRNNESVTSEPESVTNVTVSVTKGGSVTRDPELWKQAQVRAHRAAKYAERMPEHIRPSDEVYSTADWQYAQLERHTPATASLQ